MEGWSEVNLGQGGTGYSSAVTGSGAQNACGLSLCPSYDGMIAAAATAKPRIVVVSGGRNEASHDPALIVAGISKFFSDLHAALPDAKIYATSPLWDATPPPAALRLIAQSVRDSVTAAGGTYLDIGQPLTGKPDLIIPDGIHPNDAGHAAIAAAIVATYPAPAKKP